MSDRFVDADSLINPDTFILRGGHIVPMDPSIGDLSVGDVLIEHGRPLVQGPERGLDLGASARFDRAARTRMR